MADFITRYMVVSSTNLRTQTVEYYVLDMDDGLTMTQFRKDIRAVMGDGAGSNGAVGGVSVSGYIEKEWVFMNKKRN